MTVGLGSAVEGWGLEEFKRWVDPWRKCSPPQEQDKLDLDRRQASRQLDVRGVSWGYPGCFQLFRARPLDCRSLVGG